MTDDGLHADPGSRTGGLARTLLLALMQAGLFLGAAAALALFYLSYRPGGFAHTLVVTGLLLIAPWLLLSQLPALFGLRDQTLQREILGQQLLSMLVVLVVLAALTIAFGFHHQLLAQTRTLLETSLSWLTRSWQLLVTALNQGADLLLKFFNESIKPLISG